MKTASLGLLEVRVVRVNAGVTGNTIFMYHEKLVAPLIATPNDRYAI